MEMVQQTPKFFTTFETAKLLGVDMGTVIDWCQQGKLNAFKTPGGHRRIDPKDLLDFLKRFKMPIPPVLGQLVTLKCLVVDDQPEIRRIAAHVIKSIDANAQVEQAGDGFEAGAKALEHIPSLVILDIGLPGVNGFNICKRLREDPRFKQTKILAITGSDTPETKKRILDSGADDYLAKPFENKQLKERLLKLMGRTA